MGLVDHARRELELSGAYREDPAWAQSIAAAVGAFASYGHSGGSAGAGIDTLCALLQHLPLTALTADPVEWFDHGEMGGRPLWQNRRDSRAMSRDGGRTYTLVGDAEPRPVHRSAAPPGWVRAVAERYRLGEDEATAKVWAYLDAGPIVPVDLDLLAQAGDEAERRRYAARRWGEDGALVGLLLAGEFPQAPAVAGAV